jgi:hypothetical protein
VPRMSPEIHSSNRINYRRINELCRMYGFITSHEIVNRLPLISRITILLLNSADIINFPVQAMPMAMTSLSFLYMIRTDQSMSKLHSRSITTFGKSSTALILVGKPSARFSNL